jgi:hypothetical protein
MKYEKRKQLIEKKSLTTALAEECANRARLEAEISESRIQLEAELNEAKRQITAESNNLSIEKTTMSHFKTELDMYRERFAELEVNRENDFLFIGKVLHKNHFVNIKSKSNKMRSSH